MLGFLQAPRTARSRPPSCACTPMTLPRDVRPSWHRRVCSAANSPPLRVWVSLWVLVTCSFWKFSTFFFFSKFRGKEFFQSSKMLAQPHRWGEGGLGQEELRSRCGMGIWGGQQKTPRTGCRPSPALLTSPTPPGSGMPVGPYLGIGYPLTTPILLGLPSAQHNMQAQNSAAGAEVGRMEDSGGCSSLEVGEIHHLSLSFPLG